MKQYFTLLDDVLKRLGIKNKPGRIYNCDESGISLDPKREAVLAPSGSKHVYSQQNGNRDHITVHCCINAEGEYIPPMIIFEKCFPSSAYTRGGPPNTLYAKSPNGYMDSELYLEWFKKVFLKYANKERPLLLIQDGHGSHITVELIEEARINEVEIIIVSTSAHHTHPTTTG